MRLSLHLSWHQKLNVLMMATPIGLSLIVGVVIWGLSEVSSSYRALYQVLEYKDKSGEMLLEWSAVEKEIATMGAADIERIKRDLSSLGERSEGLVDSANNLGDSVLVGTAREIAAATVTYLKLRAQWLEYLQILGFSDSDGVRKTLEEAIAELEGLSISVLEQPVKTLIADARQYAGTRTPFLADQTRKNLESLGALVEKYGWEDSVIGEAVSQFGLVFDQTQIVVSEILDIEQSLQMTSEGLQRVLEAQSERMQEGLIQNYIVVAQDAKSSANIASVATALFFAPVLMVSLILISRTLVGRLNSVVELLSRVSAGDLTQRLTLGANPRDEFNRLGAAANQMIEDVGILLRDSIRSTEALLEVRAELSRTTERLKRSSESVEQQTEQAATATQEISVTVNDVARRTAEVGEAMQKTNDTAKVGEKNIDQSVANLGELSGLIQDSHQHLASLHRASEQVTGIIDVIDGLAGQTNLLALNAAIEAARAGEAGRGFSVVADEVRTLAQKTVTATNNISDIISELNQATSSMDKQMEDGVQAASQSAGQGTEISRTITQIVSSVDELTAEMDQVVVAIEEISATTEDIAQKVDLVREQSMESRAISLELERQSTLLSDHAERLQSSNSRFSIDLV
ncbi:methyl-accepting chemotaxis protein [Marinobacter sp. F3R08]|uniref:methyl-accepting chemotaxis protein n=1 Tax=Marinobacter sp. F3R08 TaxID=2841559 RepID=UPI001C09A7E3|nr:methyl-accepting chemotaxis protein [Marinobacter sp. F3R08]MBU2954765.1 methyl-accepting chemotaxis protein [Marinobacter sp. F3R08]